MPKIDYTKREFRAIKEELVSYAKRYYPNTFQDFNDASFGSIMLDSVAYIGDVLSFYLDYQSNEQFLSTAVEYKNVIELARQSGYKHSDTPTSHGMCQFFVLIPAASSGEPDERYAPVLKKGTQVSSKGGTTFTLSHDVNFAEAGLSTVVAQVDSATGLPSQYARKSSGRVISGRIRNKTLSVGSFTRFRKLSLGVEDCAEILEVTDSEGHEYVEVDYLTQNVVYKPIPNNNTNKDTVPFILKPFPAPRRFVVETTENDTVLRFGFGSDTDLRNDSIIDPKDIVLDLYAKNYTTDDGFDPKRLLESDKMGVGPADTTLFVSYRENDSRSANAPARSIGSVTSRRIEFNSNEALSPSLMQNVRLSVEVDNEEAIVGDIASPDADEIKMRALDAYAAQNRAVTREDYMALVYNMPKKFGAITRCNIHKDHDSFKNNLNLYVISEDQNNLLTTTNSTIKENLKTWLSQYKMINDTIDILDARIVNFGIDFQIMSSTDVNKYDILDDALRQLIFDMSTGGKMDIGESIKISDIYKSLTSVPGVLDVTDLQIKQISNSGYEQTAFRFEHQRSPDGRYILAPEDVIFELRYPSLDIRGSVK